MKRRVRRVRRLLRMLHASRSPKRKRLALRESSAWKVTPLTPDESALFAAIAAQPYVLIVPPSPVPVRTLELMYLERSLRGRSY